MRTLALKPSHKKVAAYHASLADFAKLGVKHETAVRAAPLNWRMEKMRLIEDKTTLVCNDFLALAGIPAAAFACRLSDRSALEWAIDQYQPAPTRAGASPTNPTAPMNRMTL